MKKFLLCMMLAGLMMPAMAQEKLSTQKMHISYVGDECDLGIFNSGILPVNSHGTLVDAGGWKSAGVSKGYDRQSQGSVYPMAAVHDDGFIGCTWTNEDCEPFEGSGTPLRGVAYSYSTDGGLTWSWNINDEATQENRIGGIPLYWSSYAQWGKHGEVVLARSADTYEYNGMQILNGLVLLTRETKGEGEWNMTVVPYPEGTSDATGYVMAWARMTTSGPDHQYIHIMAPVQSPDPTPNTTCFVYYYRTQDGGKTWDIQGESVTEMIGQDENKHASYNDAISFAVRGDIVACSFIRFGYDSYVLRSRDNGDTWESIKFFETPVSYYLYPEDYNDTCYIPSYGCIALDLNGKIHASFGMIRVSNNETEGSLGYWPQAGSQFLSYWNEDMRLFEGSVDYAFRDILEPLWYNYFDWDNSTDDQLYVNSTVPKMPVIGHFTPIVDEHLYTMHDEATEDWAGKSYGRAGMFSFPQMAFDADNVLHLVYLGLLDGAAVAAKNGTWLRHPFYTTTADEGTTWTQTEYPVNYVSLIDQEFAYMTLAGLYDDKMYLMAQTDTYPGVYTPYSGDAADHSITNNNFTVFYLDGIPTPPSSEEGIDDIGKASFPMIVQPNPASGQATVKFAGKGNITVYNMLGQVVYHVENVENQKDIPLNMASGVYFVTVRSGNATATQKLVVK